MRLLIRYDFINQFFVAFNKGNPFHSNSPFLKLIFIQSSFLNSHAIKNAWQPKPLPRTKGARLSWSPVHGFVQPVNNSDINCNCNLRYIRARMRYILKKCDILPIDNVDGMTHRSFPTVQI